MKTNVYVDAFNLYYGCVKDTSYKWLDIKKLVNLELPQNTINRIRYFTAEVKGRPNDLDQPIRQQIYIRALQTIPRLSVHYGHFLKSEPYMKLASPIPNFPNTVKVIKTEEKGSDVNIASHLLLDAFQKDCDAAVIISNDSDLITPIYMAKKHLGIKVVALLPCSPPHRPSVEIRKAASFHRIIQNKTLASSQFSGSLTDRNGTFTKPSGW